MIRTVFAAILLATFTLTAAAADIKTFTLPGSNPGWPVVEFSVPAGSSVTVSNTKYGTFTLTTYFKRRLASSAADVKYINYKKFKAGVGGIFPAETQAYDYFVGGTYFGDFGSSYGPAQVISTTFSADGKTIVVTFSSAKSKAPVGQIKLLISP